MKQRIKILQEREKRGRQIMSESSVVICSLVRDCEESLKKNIPNIERLREYFKTSEVIVIENDSKDRTKGILSDWKVKSKGVTVVSNDFGTNTIVPVEHSHPKAKYFSFERISKMASYRNQYLDELKSRYNPDFVMIIDLDVSEFSEKGIMSSFGFENEWDSISANGRKITAESPFRPVFFDTYAFKEWNDKGEFSYGKLKANQKKYSSLKFGDEFIRVNSGFNGLAIYKWNSIKEMRYRAERNEDPIVTYKCEHVQFHEDMIQAGYDKIYVNPSMLVKYEDVNLFLYIEKIKNKLQGK